MSIPPSKTEITTALATPAVAQNLIEDIRKAVTFPLAFWPEMYGAPYKEYTELPGFDPSMTAAQDTPALQQCMTRLKTQGGTLLLQRPYGLNAGLTLEVTRETVLDGQRIQGLGGAYNCGFQMVANNFNCLTIKGLDGSTKKPAHVSMQDFFIKGGSSTGRGIFAYNTEGGSDDTNVSNSEFVRLLIYTGGDGIHLGENFQTTLRHVKSSSHKGHSFAINGSNTTNLYACYASSPGEGKAGYRIYADAPVSMYSCTGLDENDSHWAIFGGMADVSGTARSGGSTLIARIATGDTAPTGYYDGMEYSVGSNRYQIKRHVANHGTHGNCLFLSSQTPLPSTQVGTEQYKIGDGLSRWANNGTSIGKDARISLYDCNIESQRMTGIKFCRRALCTIQNALFYTDAAVVSNHDCSIYINEGEDSIHSAKIVASRFDMGATTLDYPHEIVQGKGTAPFMMAERMAAGFREIHSLQTGTNLRMMHMDPNGIQLPTGFATSNPGPGRIWLNNNVLTSGT